MRGDHRAATRRIAAAPPARTCIKTASATPQSGGWRDINAHGTFTADLVRPFLWATRVHKANPPSGNPVVLSAPRAAQLFHFSKRVTCRLAVGHVERDAIFKLRYRSYLRAGLISQNSFGRYLEHADHAANTCLMGLYVERKLVSSLRLQMVSP